MKQTTLFDRKKICNFFAIVSIGLAMSIGGSLISVAGEVSAGNQSDSSVAVEHVPALQEPDQQLPAGEVQERGLKKLTPRKGARGRKTLPPPYQSGGELPANLCHQETHMMTQCRCFNDADCQVLSTLCPGSCPSGSQTCQCTPMFRGTPPALPPDLCGYQVPFTITKCSCNNDADCQVLSTVCPGACPAGSHTCQCSPLQRR